MGRALLTANWIVPAEMVVAPVYVFAAPEGKDTTGADLDQRRAGARTGDRAGIGHGAAPADRECASAERDITSRATAAGDHSDRLVEAVQVKRRTGRVGQDDAADAGWQGVVGANWSVPPKIVVPAV